MKQHHTFSAVDVRVRVINAILKLNARMIIIVNICCGVDTQRTCTYRGLVQGMHSKKPQICFGFIATGKYTHFS